MKRYPSWLPKVLIALVVVPLVAAVLFPIFAESHSDGPHNACLFNLKQMMLASVIYASDYDEHFEKADGWMDALLPYTKTEVIFHDKSGVPEGEYGHAFRDLASGVDLDDIKDQAAFIVAFDSSLTGRSAHGELWSVPQPGRHMGGDNVGFADGHVKGIFPKPENPNQTALVSAFQKDEASGPMPAKTPPKSLKSPKASDGQR